MGLLADADCCILCAIGSYDLGKLGWANQLLGCAGRFPFSLFFLFFSFVSYNLTLPITTY
jgi:hypothetical protein